MIHFIVVDADVWKGEYQGHEIAVKVLKVYLTDGLDKITRAGCQHTCPVFGKLIVAFPEILQGGYDLEVPSTSKIAPTRLGVTMTRNQLAMTSEWMIKENIGEFIKAHRDVDRFGLAGRSRRRRYLHIRLVS